MCGKELQSVWQLVRQVISLLRSQLQDKSRPYEKLFEPFPKQGYLFDVEVTQSGVR